MATMEKNSPFIVCDNLVKQYRTGSLEHNALNGLGLEVQKGEVLAIVGPSGSGKSTLMNILGGFDRPTSGSVSVDGADLLNITPEALTRYRRDLVGFIRQQTEHNLLPYMTVFQNVCLPVKMKGLPRHKIVLWAEELLDMVGMSRQMHYRANQLSAGERQRAAIAVALANSPRLLLADEPASALDSVAAGAMIDLLRDLAHRYEVTVVITSRDAWISQHADMTVSIFDGRTNVERVPYDKAFQVVREEFLSVDRAGRLQLPKELVERLVLKGKVRMLDAQDHVEIWPVDRKKH